LSAVALNPLKAMGAFGWSRLSADTASIPALPAPAKTMMPSGGACESDCQKGNLFSSGTVSAAPIGVNAPMTSPQAAVAANRAANFELPNTAQRAAIALIRTKALVGAAISQNALET
jgi:hypothetical protein